MKSLRSALKIAVAALDGDIVVGAKLWPEMSPDTAGERLAHCLELDRRERLNLDQIGLIFKAACSKGKHDGFRAFAEFCGYDAAPVTIQAQFIEAMQHAQDAKRDAEQAIQDLEMLTNNPRLLALADARHLKVRE